MEMEGGWAETPVSMVEPSDLFLCCTCHECQLLLLDSQQLKTQLKKYVAMLGFGYLGNGKWVSMRGDYIILQAAGPGSTKSGTFQKFQEVSAPVTHWFPQSLGFCRSSRTLTLNACLWLVQKGGLHLEVSYCPKNVSTLFLCLPIITRDWLTSTVCFSMY